MIEINWVYTHRYYLTAPALCWVINVCFLIVFGCEGVEVVAGGHHRSSGRAAVLHPHRTPQCQDTVRRTTARGAGAPQLWKPLLVLFHTNLPSDLAKSVLAEVNSEMVISSCIIFSGGRELMCKSRFWFCILVSTAVQENRSHQIDTSLLGTAAPI